jgi:hypothetical protein
LSGSPLIRRAFGDQPDTPGDPAAMGRIVDPLCERYGIR